MSHGGRTLTTLVQSLGLQPQYWKKQKQQQQQNKFKWMKLESGNGRAEGDKPGSQTLRISSHMQSF